MPTMTLAEYKDVRHLMIPGDIIAFGGISNPSEIIKYVTKSLVSHVAVIMHSKLSLSPETVEFGFFNQVIESTSISGFKGVSITRLSDRINHYNGDIWWLPLNRSNGDILDNNYKEFFDFLLRQEGKEYDMPQAVKAGLDKMNGVPVFSGLTHAEEDFSRLFCSELAAAALEIAGLITDVNASEVTPRDLCMFDIYEEEYFNLRGGRHIAGYNSLDPTGWGTL